MREVPAIAPVAAPVVAAPGFAASAVAAPAVTAPVFAAATPAVTSHHEAAPFGAAPAVPSYQPMAGSLGFGSTFPSFDGAYGSASVPIRDESPSNAYVWIIALSPLISIGIALIAFLFPIDEGFTSTLIRASSFGMAALAAFKDAEVLRARELPSASVRWILLGPLGYLFARQHKLRKNGIKHYAPGNVYAGTLLAAIALTLVASFGSAYAGPTTAEMDAALISTVEEHAETQLESTAAGNWTVVCTRVEGASIPGTPVPCKGNADDGRQQSFVAVLQPDDTITFSSN